MVDDQPENRRLIKLLLSHLGLEVKEADDGAAAVACWHQWQPNLIWMDIRMPNLDGYEATKQIRAAEASLIHDLALTEADVAVVQPTTASTKIIALTAQGFIEDQAQALAAGCDDFLSKPFQANDLFALMTKHLGLRYVYANEVNAIPATPPPEPPDLTPAQLACMPPDWISAVNRAACQCDDEEIMDLLAIIPPEHTTLIQGMTALAHNFEFRTLIQLTESETRSSNTSLGTDLP